MKQFLLIVLISTTIASKAQFYVGAGTGGTTRGKLAAELQVGYNFKFLLLQTGFVTHTNNTDPAIFQFKTGHEFRFRKQSLVISAGYAYQLLSNSHKENNKSTYTSGIEYLKYIRTGAIYTGVTKSDQYTFITVGLKYFFFPINNRSRKHKA
jgi:hypothetical protein